MGSISALGAHAETTTGTSKCQNTKARSPSALRCITEIYLLLSVGTVFFFYSTRTTGIHSVTLLGTNEDYGKLRAEKDLHGALSMELRLLGHQLGVCAFTDVCVKKGCKPVTSFGHIFFEKLNIQFAKKKEKSLFLGKLKKKNYVSQDV